MNKIMVSVFPTETAAYAGLRALKDLHEEGDITLFAQTVLVKNEQGIVSTRESSDGGPVGSVVGIVGGALVGLLGGPAGVVVGAYVGGSAGLLFDLFNVGFGGDVVDEIAAEMKPGSVAIVADIDESWITPVETVFAPLGAITFRRNAGEAIDDRLNREVDEANAEFNQLKAELREANGEARATVEKKLQAQAYKLDELGKKIEQRMSQLDTDLKSRLATLRTQREKAVEARKADIDARTAEIKASFELRRQKLQHAHELSQQAHELRVEALKP